MSFSITRSMSTCRPEADRRSRKSEYEDVSIESVLDRRRGKLLITKSRANYIVFFCFFEIISTHDVKHVIMIYLVRSVVQCAGHSFQMSLASFGSDATLRLVSDVSVKIVTLSEKRCNSRRISHTMDFVLHQRSKSGRLQFTGKHTVHHSIP